MVVDNIEIIKSRYDNNRVRLYIMAEGQAEQREKREITLNVDSVILAEGQAILNFNECSKDYDIQRVLIENKLIKLTARTYCDGYRIRPIVSVLF